MRGRGHGRHHGHGEGPFRKGGFRKTAPRQAVLEVMRDAEDYLSADEVYRKVYEHLPGIGIATVYRTLQLLAELGALARVTGDDGKARYRFTDEGAVAHRLVLVCRSCGGSEAVPSTTGVIGDRLGALTTSVAEEHDFTVEQSVHQYYGLCGSCSTTHHD